MSNEQVPAEVDFAARYFGGDWTEGMVPEVRPAWYFGDEEEPFWVVADPTLGTYNVLCFDGAGRPQVAEVFRHDDGTFVVIGRDAAGNPTEPVCMRLDIHDTGYVIVDVPNEQ